MKSTKASFKSSVVQYNSIMDRLQKGGYSSSYLLMGEEEFFIDKIADFIIQNGSDGDELAQTIFYGADTKIEEVLSVAKSFPMFSEKNIVVVKDAQKLKDINHLHLYFKDPIASTIVVLCYKGGNLDKRSTLYKSMVSAGEVFESVAAREWEIGDWINNQILKLGFSIEPVALNMLVDNLGTSLNRIDNEIIKLTTRLDSSIKKITATHIEDNIGISKEFNNFELTKAISTGNRKRALLIADHFAMNPKEHPVVVTLPTLFNHFQRIFLFGLTIWKCRKTSTPMPNDAELAKQLGLPTSFFLAEYKEAVKIYSSARAFKILELIRDYDARSKGVGSVSGGDGAVLKELLLKIFMVK